MPSAEANVHGEMVSDTAVLEKYNVIYAETVAPDIHYRIFKDLELLSFFSIF